MFMFTQFKTTRLLPYAALLLIAAIFLAACANQPAAQVNTANSGANSAQTAPTTAAGTNNSTAVPTTAANAAAPTAGSTAAGSTAPVSFAKDVLPILQNSCVSCHGGEKTSKGLDLKTYASLMTGSQNGAVITAGDASNSKLIQSIQSGKMPKRGGPLPADQIQLLVEWVNAGATNN